MPKNQLPFRIAVEIINFESLFNFRLAQRCLTPRCSFCASFSQKKSQHYYEYFNFFSLFILASHQTFEILTLLLFRGKFHFFNHFCRASPLLFGVKLADYINWQYQVNCNIYYLRVIQFVFGPSVLFASSHRSIRSRSAGQNPKEIIKPVKKNTIKYNMLASIVVVIGTPKKEQTTNQK